MARTDVHAPAAFDFDPQAYDCFGVFDLNPESGEGRAKMEMVNVALGMGYRFASHQHSGQCGHCGARIRYAALMLREDVKEMIYVGETCLDGRFEMTKNEFQELRKAAKLDRERVALQEKLTALCDGNPDIAYATYAHNMEVAGGIITTDECDAYCAEQANFYGTPCTGHYVRNTKFVEKTRTGREFSVISDMAFKAMKYGELSDKQANYLHNLLEKISKAADDLAAREAHKQTLPELAEGKRRIEGTVVSSKVVDGFYGASYKMVVELADGTRVFGTVPSHFGDVSKGDEVTFTATIERSKDDASFGFYKRPSQASIEKVVPA